MTKYKTGEKFIIEIESIYQDSDLPFTPELYKIKGFKTAVFDDYGLDKLQNYDEVGHKLELIEELKQAEYNRGLKDAWELARKICFDMSGSERAEVFGYTLAEDFMENEKPQKALAELETYRESKEIKVGDVVILDDETKAVVMDIDCDNTLWVYTENGINATMEIDKVEKTDKHIDIKKILDELRK